jgi:hypothetical protein
MRYHFEGRLTARDCKRHIQHAFVAPPNSQAIEIRFQFTPQIVYGMANMLTLTVFDPDGFRGAGHRHGAEHQARIGPAEATPGYLPGPLPAGTWTAQIDTHMIMPGEALRYSLDITIGAEGTAASAATRARPRSGPQQRGAGWYRGDLHSHTHHSDAGERTVTELIQTARDYGLDFIFLTDHNTTAGLAEMDAAATDDLLTAGGLELTTFWGHALCLGTREWIDWRVRPGSGDMARIAAEAYASSQVFIIAHPASIGDPDCTGCTWRFGDMMPGAARLVEIWNGPWRGDSNNEAALALWYDWLNQGLRVIATAGTDSHSSRDYAARPGFSVIYGEELSEAALLKALLAGHLYLSSGPRVTFAAHGDRGRSWISGDTIDQAVTLAIGWDGCPPDAQVRLLANGRLLDQRLGGAHGQYAWDLAPDQADWVIMEIRGGDGELLAIANPIFVQARAPVPAA